MIELVAFLGNHGREYAENRHNAGRILAGYLPFASALTWQGKFKGLYSVLDQSRISPAAADALVRALASGAEKLLPEWGKKKLAP